MMKGENGESVRVRSDRKEFDHDVEYSKSEIKRKSGETSDKRFAKRPRDRSRDRERERERRKDRDYRIEDKDRHREKGRERYRDGRVSDEGLPPCQPRVSRLSSRERRASLPSQSKLPVNVPAKPKQGQKLLSELSEFAVKKTGGFLSIRDSARPGSGLTSSSSISLNKSALHEGMRTFSVTSATSHDEKKISPFLDAASSKKKKDRWADSDDEGNKQMLDENASEEGEILAPTELQLKSSTTSPASRGTQLAEVTENLLGLTEQSVSMLKGKVAVTSEFQQQAAADKHQQAIDELKAVFSRDCDLPSQTLIKSIDTEASNIPKVVDNYNPLIHGCRSVEHFERIKYLAEGAYGLVFMARNRVTKEIVAIKQVKMSNEAQKEGFPITALRETNVLLSLYHPNIVRVHEMVTGSNLDKIYMVMEYFDADMKSVISDLKKRGEKLETAEVKCLMQQLLRAVAHLHERWYIHRDLKTSNLLYNSKGKLAICDFGLARRYEDPIRPYTQTVVTLWYRSPELLLGARQYATEIDMWSIGCIFGELLLGEPMFQGQGEVDQLSKIFSLLGAPSEERWPGWTELPGTKTLKWRAGTRGRLAEKFPAASFSGGTCLSKTGLNLLSKLLSLDPKGRINASDALKHPWFSEAPLPKDQHEMPAPPKNEIQL